MNQEAAFAEVEKNEDYIVDVLQKIIAVDTSIPPGENYGRLIDIVEPDFNRFGLETERVVVPEDKVRQMPWDLHGERVNLVATLKNDKPKASAYAHMDVVPIDEPWTRDPFGGEVVDGKLYGRGTVDMKGSIACFLGAMKVLSDLGLEPKYSVNCLLCTDEEIGHRSVTVCHLANIAILLKRKIRWDPAKEQIIGDEEATRMLHKAYRAPWHL